MFTYTRHKIKSQNIKFRTTNPRNTSGMKGSSGLCSFVLCFLAVKVTGKNVTKGKIMSYP